MDKNEFYDRLGITPEERNLDDEQFEKVLKSKFRKASIKWHPDKHSNDSEEKRREAEEKFKEIAEAYEVLSDPQKKRQYDMFGTFDSNASNMSGMDFGSIFENFFGGNSFFGGGQKRQTIQRGTDKTLRIGVTLKELYSLKSKTVRFKKYVHCDACGGTGSRSGGETTCPYCHGTGMITHTQRNGFSIFQTSMVCDYCNGEGTIMKEPCSKCDGQGIVEKECDINVPIGDIMSCNDQRFVMNGQGNACARKKGPNGNLYYSFRIISANDGFNFEENDPYNLVSEVKVPLLTCLTGGVVQFTHIDGKVLNLKVKSCTADGEKIVKKSLGLPKQEGRGDLGVIVRCQMPKSLNKEDLELIEELKKSPSFS